MEPKPTSGQCASIAGNGRGQSVWIGICGTSLRSHIGGGANVDVLTAGTLVQGKWTHIAVTFDATTRTHAHYVDGEPVGSRVASTGIPASTNPWRIFNDPAHEISPWGQIDELRFWNVARTLSEIRATINQKIRTATPGLVAVFPFDSTAEDAVGASHGTARGEGGYRAPSHNLYGCTDGTSRLCINGERHLVEIRFTHAGTSKIAKVVPFSTTDSGIFYFFDEANWEVMVKVINGCFVNGRTWFFASGVTDLHYEMIVTDVERGTTRRYFNYAGEPARAVIDTDAFANCAPVN